MSHSVKVALKKLHAIGKLLTVPENRKVGVASSARIPNTEIVLLHLLASTRTDNHVRSLGAKAAAITRTIRRARHHQFVFGKCCPHPPRPADAMGGLRLFAVFFKK